MTFLRLLIVLTASIASEFEHELEYAGALRGRGLYRLSELQCKQLLGNDDLAPEQRVQVTVEYSKTLSARALNARRPTRDEYWKRAFGILTDELQRSNEPSAALLLRTQLALTTVQRAEWTRREAEVRASSDEDWELARSQVREAIKQLKQVEQELSRPRMRSGGEGLSVARVAELLRNTGYQLSRAYRNQAITYAARPADRVSSLTMALKRLQPIAGDLVADDLVWQSRIDRIQCYRLRGEWEKASQLIAAASSAPDEFLGRLAAEAVRLALDARRPQVALKLVRNQQVKSNHPDFELARIETLVALAQQDVDATTTRMYQRQAAETASKLDQYHGTYWGLRGEMLIARLADRDSGKGDTDLLETAAKTMLKRALPENATEMFVRAAQQAESGGDLARAFEYRHKAATVDHQQGNLQPAIDRFRDVALKFPQNSKAPETHLLAAFDAAALYQQHARSGPSSAPETSLAQYESLLHEHLAHWPDAGSADQARIWLGRLAEAKREWDLAIGSYQGVSPGSEHASDAYGRLGNLHQRRFSAPTADHRTNIELARDWFETRLSVEQDPQAAVVLGIESARLAMLHAPRDYAAAEKHLRRSMPAAESEPSQHQTVGALLVVATAGVDSMQQARQRLNESLPLPMSPLIEILKGLQPIRDARPDDAELQSMSLEILKLIQAYRAQLQPNDRLLLEQVVADASDKELALEAYQRLASTHPKHRRIQRRYAELLSLGRDRASREQALKQWRLIVSQSRRQSVDWFHGKLGVAQAHFDKGEHEKAQEVVELLMTLYPEMGGRELRALFQQLLDRAKKSTS